MPDRAGTWSIIELAGHPCDVYEPQPPEVERPIQPPQVIIYLHGLHSTRLADAPVFSQQIAQLGIPVLCPETKRSWWNDRVCLEFDPRLTAERHILDNVVPYIAARWQAKPPQIALLGTSMGGQGALRLAFKHANTFPIAAAISPAIDFQIRWREGDETLRSMYADEETARQDTATLHLHPLNWPRNIWFCCDPEDYRWFDSADRLRMKLAALGIPREVDLTTTGGGHSWEYYERMAPSAIAFLAERLDRESRRVV
jgi:enterochelin esterase-like enzyme